ncbi:hypothetical protein TIFTF001_004595 [Ficus carica]|uniref:Uncharacterized protein n=1 Tax=Ficus carica TaxID=3494 RepID=A0AA88A523_FICCA|nr:hypothetical protein TIFTF001_004595 [Ficus carica]
MDANPTWRGCTNSRCCIGNPVEDGSHRPMLSTTSTNSHALAASSGCKLTLDGMVRWLFHGVADTFFASLQRCSCIKIETRDDNVDDYFKAATDHNLHGDEVLHEVEIS